MYKYILFDLDGTVTDPGEGITKSVAHALSYWDIHVDDLTKLYCFIGPPLVDSFMEYYGFSKEDAVEAMNKYRERYGVVGLFENVPYEGIEDLFIAIRNSGRKIILATSKPEEFSVRILEKFDLIKYFDHVCGASLDENRSKKADVIKYALKTAGITDTSEVLMVGDRQHDIIGARENSIDCLAVLYGYGNREEFEEHGAKYIAENVEDIMDIIESCK